MKKLADLITANDVGEALEYIHAMIALVERDGTLISWNRAFETYKTNYPHASDLQNCFSSRERDRISNRLDLTQPDPFVVEIETGGEGKSVFYDCVILPLADGHSLFIAEHISSDASMQEIIQRLNRRIKMFQVESEHAKKIARNKQTEVEGIVVQAHELSNTDVLTFLPNRRMIVKTLQDEVARAERYSAPLSISVVDVDFFKRVNDTHGHMAGDEVLRHIAYLLRDHIRHPDVVGRYGGEEFLILLPNTASEEAAEQASRLCRHVREAQVNVNHQHYLSLTVSIGVAQYQPGVDTWESLLNRADNAMYEAKNNGRDRWCVAK
jgi:diguanylate cyclase (GGDEF)-like protein